MQSLGSDLAPCLREHRPYGEILQEKILRLVEEHFLEVQLESDQLTLWRFDRDRAVMRLPLEQQSLCCNFCKRSLS